jgi:glycosyltransferase involved in cell wall biosynthesis/capsular polysaccharide biosynthesis protein
VKIVWSLPVRGESLSSTRGDLVRARALIEALREEGHRVVVVEDGSASSARVRVTAYRRIVRPLLPARVATVFRDALRVAHGWAHGRRVAQVAIGEGADLIVETQVHFAGSAVGASRLSGVPFVLDDCSPWTEEKALGAGLPVLARKVFQKQARAAVGLVVPSVQIRDRLMAEGAPPQRIHVVPNGVHSHAFETVDRTAARQRWGFDEEVVVAFVGSFQPWHRVELLLEVVHRRPETPLHLLLIGEGPGRDGLAARAETLGISGRVTLPGPLSGPDLATALVASDIGALPSSNDYGQPMKLLDYAAAGLSIVAADVPPVRDMVEPGATGVIVPREDLQALAEALATLAETPQERARLGGAARSRLAAPASWRCRARMMLEGAARLEERADAMPEPEPGGDGSMEPTTAVEYARRDGEDAPAGAGRPPVPPPPHPRGRGNGGGDGLRPSGPYLRALRRWWWLPVATALVCTAAALLATSRETPRYAATATAIVAPTQDLVDSSELLRSFDTLERRTVVATFARIASTREIREAAGEELGLTSAQLRGHRLSASVISSTNLIHLRAEGPDPEVVAALANAATLVTEAEVRRLYRIFTLHPVETATRPSGPVHPDPQRNSGVGLVLGLLLGVFAAIAIEAIRGPVAGVQEAPAGERTPAAA